MAGMEDFVLLPAVQDRNVLGKQDIELVEKSGR